MVNEFDIYAGAPLHQAMLITSDKRLELIDFLLEQGGDINRWTEPETPPACPSVSH